MRIIRLLAAGLLLALLGACGAATLIQLNTTFVDLSKNNSDLESMRKSGGLAELNYEAAVEGLRQRFAENGDAAVDAAKKADKAAAKVSFLNVAARSYLESGPVADGKIPTISDEGRTLCQGDELKGLNALPTTCGYFYIVDAQAISNEQTRSQKALVRAAAAARAKGGELSVESAKRIVATFRGYGEARKVLAGGEGKIDWVNASPELRTVFLRQQDLIYCNAADVPLLLPDAPQTGPDWDRHKADEEMTAALGQWIAALRQRPGGFDRAKACARR